jgi:hypothetical protein
MTIGKGKALAIRTSLLTRWCDNHSEDHLIHRSDKYSGRRSAENLKFDLYGSQNRHCVMKQFQSDHGFAIIGYVRVGDELVHPWFVHNNAG